MIHFSTRALRSSYTVLPKQPFQLKRNQPSKPAKLDLKLKRMKDSYIEQFLFFKSDPMTRELYINFAGNIRIAKVLENLDALAGAIAYQHADDGKIFSDPDSQIVIVTAAVDRIDLKKMPTPKMDMKIYGHVSHVGHSSMEITLKCSHLVYKKDHMKSIEDVQGFNQKDLESSLPIHAAASPELSEILKRVYFGQHNSKVKDLNANIESEIPVMTATFSMVARDAFTQTAVQIHPLKLDTKEEHEIFNKTQNTRNLKKQQAQQSLVKQPPTSDELKSVHQLFLKTQLSQGVLHAQQNLSALLEYSTKKESFPGMIYMKDTSLETVGIMQPQDRNIHNFIFGGYLMKTAYELAYCTSMIYTNGIVEFMAMDDITFRKPVPIGAILKLKSMIAYSPQPNERHYLSEKWKDAFQCQVVADVIIDNKVETSNVFHFTFRPAKPMNIKYVVPQTYQESLLYVMGKRTFENGIKIDE